jgi:hypothetical protein
MDNLNLRILNAVLNAGYYIESREVVELVHADQATVRRHLAKLWREKKIHRQRSPREGRAFVYCPMPGVEVTAGPVEEELVLLPGDEDVDAAIERTRPHWRIGERIPLVAKQGRYSGNAGWQI